MAFADDLLEQAAHLANREKKKPRQASLRRAVSTAYYALFHLLIDEAAKNWKRVPQRSLLARGFEHGKLKNACDKKRADLTELMRRSPLPPPNDLAVAERLHRVVSAFIQAQQQRHTADYDNGRQWTRTEALTQIAAVRDAFDNWKDIRKEDMAQDYLVSLLIKDR